MANEPTSDYGYDMVHGDLGQGNPAREDAPASAAPGARPADPQGRDTGRPPGTESTGDHGYDEAHDF